MAPAALLMIVVSPFFGFDIDRVVIGGDHAGILNDAAGIAGNLQDAVPLPKIEPSLMSVTSVVSWSKSTP